MVQDSVVPQSKPSRWEEVAVWLPTAVTLEDFEYANAKTYRSERLIAELAASRRRGEGGRHFVDPPQVRSPQNEQVQVRLSRGFDRYATARNSGVILPASAGRQFTLSGDAVQASAIAECLTFGLLT